MCNDSFEVSHNVEIEFVKKFDDQNSNLSQSNDITNNVKEIDENSALNSTNTFSDMPMQNGSFNMSNIEKEYNHDLDDQNSNLTQSNGSANSLKEVDENSASTSSTSEHTLIFNCS